MNAGAVISAVQPNSKAVGAGLVPGDRLVRVNGRKVRDLIDLSFALAEDRIELEVEKASGEKVQLSIRKSLDESMGFEFESAVFDRVRTCGRLNPSANIAPPYLRLRRALLLTSIHWER